MFDASRPICTAVRLLCVALVLMMTSLEGISLSPEPPLYGFDLDVHDGGDDLVFHALESFGTGAQIQCTQQPNSTAVQCRHEGRIVMTALEVTTERISIWVYANPPPALEKVLSQVVRTAWAHPGEVNRIVPWGNVPTSLRSLTGN